MISDTPVDFGCIPGDIAVGTGYQLAGAGVNPVQIQPLTASGYQFIFTGGGADIWVSCLSTTSPLARTARAGKAGPAPDDAGKASGPTGKSDRPVTGKSDRPVKEEK